MAAIPLAFRFAAEVAAFGRTPPDRSGAPIGRCVARRVLSRQPVDTGPVAIPVWRRCPVFPMFRYPAAVRTVSGLFLSAFVLRMSRFGMNRPDVVA